MLKTLLLPIAVFSLASCSQEVKPEQSAAYATEAVKLFEQACVQTGGGAAAVGEWAGQQPFQKMTAEDIKNLPPGMMELDAQSVWQTERQGAVFYLSTTSDSCNVKTAKADGTVVEKAFDRIALAGRPGIEPRLEEKSFVSSPFPFTRIAYIWHETDSGGDIRLTANMSSSEQLPAQLALSFIRPPANIPAVNGE
ncbi:NMCC_0638 family (lipo)protein [Neisseria montereyensis]|uniref:Lipoprotein n=1 Tax=Neisseria montereyensis TaxID=2973938 RepID=A0ABT2FCD2_9NEIS|nr:hypothetical protein [Neisseria montereyensis]MCS4533816.1 hypothetical protein [Neisseria montereyensis]